MAGSLLTKLSSVGIEAIDWTKMTLVQIVSFIEKQAPSVLQEWINWNFWTSFIIFCVSLAFIVFTIFFWRYSLKVWKELSYDEESLHTGLRVGLTVFSITAIFVTIGMSDWLQILIAPRVWILQHIKELF